MVIVAGHAHEYDAQGVPLERLTMVVKVVDDELMAFEVDGLILGELGTEWVAVTSGDRGFS
jgi:hypothetical protein